MILKLYKIVPLLILFFSSCSLFEPVDENHNTFNRIFNDPSYAEGLLINAYSKLPTSYLSFNDVATDDAVSNQKLNGYLRMATGQWTAQFNPVGNWDNMNKGLLYLDLLIPEIEKIEWDWNNEDVNRMFEVRLTGEAHALRGVLRYFLLQNIAGKTTDGKLLGIPLFDQFQEIDTDFNSMGRSDFSESVAAINADFDKAIQLLPMDFRDISDKSQLPAEFSQVKIADYNKVFGDVSNQRITKRIAMGFKSRLALLVASPAFNPDNNSGLWVNAANLSAEVLAGINGLSGLDPNGHRFYEGDLVDAVSVGNDSQEMLWRGSSHSLSNDLEKRMFPPGLNGLGEVNPTQNLVDAFPMIDGYPIRQSANYDPSNPYENRDPRLGLYILYNNAEMQGKIIKTNSGGGVNAKDSLDISTRTGYYLRKLIREDIIFSADGSAITRKHYAVHMRYTELFLNYAEAANEVWGPDGTGGIANYSAREVISAIRNRAGINSEDYLNSITSKEKMRELIYLERRLELCFEGFRFWDMRRWGLPLNETAKGVNINRSNTTYQVVDVEPRVYQPYMQYPPIPHSEVMKFSELKQNAGW